MFGLGLGIISLIVFIGLVIVLNAVFKRNCAEAMFVAWLVVALMGGGEFFQLIQISFMKAMTETALFPAMYFCFMAVLMEKTGIIKRLVMILNSVFGRIRGGPGYVSTCASALMGMVSGSGSGNAAVSGSITIPWMKESGFSAERATVIVTGNATLGMSIPPSSAMFMLLALPAVATLVTPEQLYLSCLCGGMWVLLFRLLTVWFFIRKDGIEKVDSSYILPLKQTLHEGGKSLLVFLGILIPICLTAGPISNILKSVESLGKKGVGAINMIVWIPVLLCLITVAEGWRQLPHSLGGWASLLKGCIGSYTTIGGAMFFAFAGSEVMSQMGLQGEMEVMFQSLTGMPLWLMLILMGIIILVLAGPLTSVATLVTAGSVCFTALVSVGGMRPSLALVCIIVLAATEGSTPPASAPLFVASGISRVADPNACYKDLILYYAAPSLIIALLLGLQILPIL